jgi:hypothetical protein
VIPHTVFKETDMAMKARKKAKTTKAKRRPAKAAKKAKLASKAKKAKKATKAKARKKVPARRAAAKKAKRPAAKATKAKRKSNKSKDVIGEGNYTAARNFRKNETAFIDNNRNTIARKAKEAEAAIDGPEGAELERAREETAARGQE